MATRRKSIMGVKFEAVPSLPARRVSRLSTIPNPKVQPKKKTNVNDDFVSGEVFAFEPISTPKGPLTRARRSSVYVRGPSASATAVVKTAPAKLVALVEAEENVAPSKTAKPAKPLRAKKVAAVKTVVASPEVTPEVKVSPKVKKTPGRRARIVTPVSEKLGGDSDAKSTKKYAKTPAANRSGKKAEPEPSTQTRKSTRKAKVEEPLDDPNLVKSVRKSARKIAKDAKLMLLVEDPASSTPMPSQQADTVKAESKLMKLLVTLTPTTPKIFNALSKKVFFTDFARANLPRSPYVLMKGWTETGTPVEHMEKLEVNLKAGYTLSEPDQDTPDSPLPRNPKRKLNISDLVDDDEGKVSPKKACLSNTSICEDPQLVTGYLGKMCTIM